MCSQDESIGRRAVVSTCSSLVLLMIAMGLAATSIAAEPAAAASSAAVAVQPMASAEVVQAPDSVRATEPDGAAIDPAGCDRKGGSCPADTADSACRENGTCSSAAATSGARHGAKRPSGFTEAQLQQARWAVENNLTVILVLNPDFDYDWERVPVDAYTNATLLPFAAKARDILTTASDDPQGELLELSNSVAADAAAVCFAIKPVVGRASCTAAFEEVGSGVTHAWVPSILIAFWQLTRLADIHVKDERMGPEPWNFRLPEARLKLTSAESFWDTVETTAATGTLSNTVFHDNGNKTTPGWYGIPSEERDITSRAYQVLGISGSVVVLPELGPMVNNDKHQNKTAVFGKPGAWNADTVVSMVRRFCAIANVTTVPSLDEYALSAHKVMYGPLQRAYYEQDTTRRTPPIPAALMEAPMRKEEAAVLCLTDLHEPSEALVDATMQAIFEGLLELERMVPASDPVRQFTTWAGQKDPEIAYVLKRDYAGETSHMLMDKLPASLLKEQLDTKPWRTRKPYTYSFAGASQVRPEQVQAPQLLRAPALHLLRHSCGSKWLLQWKLRDFDIAEYRVYLLGGAAATGGANDTLPVYTPALIGANHAIYMKVHTIPQGHFWHDKIPPPCGGEDSHCRAPHATDGWANHDRVAWPSQRFHGKLVSAALDGVQALTTQEPGMRMVSNVFARVDLYMNFVTAADGARHPFALVSEVEWFNSACIMPSLWASKEAHVMADQHLGSEGRPQNAAGLDVAALQAAQATSPAATIARPLAQELVHSYLSGFVGQ